MWKLAAHSFRPQPETIQMLLDRYGLEMPHIALCPAVRGDTARG